jgi:phosphoglucomutase
MGAIMTVSALAGKSAPKEMLVDLTRLEREYYARQLSPEAVNASTVAGDPIIAKLTRAPSDGAPISGLKVVARRGWFAARPSGTENICKIYAESFLDQSHLDAIVAEARAIVDRAMGSSA